VHAENDEKVEEDDRERYRKEVVALGEKLGRALPSARSGPAEQAIWEVYAGTEKLIAVLKLRLDYETPGVFAELPKASDPVKLLEDACEVLSKGAEEISRGNLIESIETLRTARNALRSYLTERQKSATKRVRNLRGEPPV
jgi:hypothetical protein